MSNDPDSELVAVGSSVKFRDENGKMHNALVTIVHGKISEPTVNLLYVTDDVNATDQYGAQIVRANSVVHESRTSAKGNYWTSM